MIKATNLSLTIQQQVILQAIDLNIAKGDYLAIVGPNGSGKSSLIRLINGILKPSSGQLTINGRMINQYSSRELARQISYVPQNSGQQLPFIVEDFIKMARYPYHSALSEWSSQDQEAIEQALAITNTSSFRQRQMQSLSGGEAQRVMIAAALCQHTEIMLLDEPSSYLDPHHQLEVHQLIKQLNQQHDITIIEVTHDINHASQHAKHILALKQGSILWTGPSREFLTADRLKDLYDQDFVFVQHPINQAQIALPNQ